MVEEEKKNGELLIDNMQFALLYNVEGLKYTIGQTFESRRRQGEYLYCFGEGVSKKSHCEITCGSGGQFWVEDLQGSTGNGTFLNGERIDGKGKVELKFSDILTLGDSNLKRIEGEEMEEQSANPVGMGGGGCTVLLFKALKSQSADDKETEMVDSRFGSHNGSSIMMVEPSPIGIPLVLSKILAYLSISDIKNCRLVCSQWKEMTNKLLETNSVTNFNYDGLHLNFMSATKSSRLFTFVHTVRDFPRGRFHVKFPTCITPNRLCDHCTTDMVNWDDNSHIRFNLERKIFSDVRWFFGGGYPHPITKLSLTGTFKHKTFRQLFLDVLKGCSLHLHDLTLSTSVNFRGGCNHLEAFEVTFPSLKVLEISLDKEGCDSVPGADHGWIDAPYSRMENWIGKMVTSAPGLQSLKLPTWKMRLSTAPSFGEAFLNKIITENGFSNLNSLELCSCNCHCLNSILKLSKFNSLKLPLLDFDLHSEERRHPNTNEGEPLPTWSVLLGNVLGKSADTLKFLNLSLPRVDPYRVRQSLSLPVFPNLKVFKLSGFFTFCFALPNPGLGFADHFPTLKHFDVSVNLNGHSNREVAEDGFFNTLFPGIGNRDRYIGEEDYDDDQGGDTSKVETGSFLWDDPTTKKKPEEEHVVKSVKLLEIQNLEEWSPFGVKRMNKLFPNAFNKHLDALRA